MESKSKFHPITHVLFDLDGVLLDTEPHFFKTDSEVCEKYGCKLTMEAKRMSMGQNASGTASTIIKMCGLPITVEEYLKEFKKSYDTNFANIDIMPGALKLLQHLHKHGIHQAIATSGTRFSYEFKARKYLHHFDTLFEHVMTGGCDSAVKAGKPKPDIFLVAAQRFKEKPKDLKNVLVFEDSPMGLEAGISAGMQVVWVSDLRYVDPVSLNAHKANLTIPSLEDFDPTLFGLPDWD